PNISGNILKTTDIILSIFEERRKIPIRDLAFSVHNYLAEGLADLAMKIALENDIRVIGFTGGVAANQIITQRMREIIESNGLVFLTHELIPPGDGGLSFGQAYIAAHT
ncbi:MAG: carbamoyltransferase HypF, partial [Candidatus Bathyarchaeia archaeon]